MFAGDMGAEEYGPPAPTSTQIAIQTGRDVLTSQVPLTPTTLYIMVGGVVAAYFLYQWMYGESEA